MLLEVRAADRRPRLGSSIGRWSEAFTKTLRPKAHDHEANLFKIIDSYALEDDDLDEISLSIRRNAGNIHRRPKSSARLGADAADFNKWLDDGGSDFEVAAANLVEARHFEALVELNSMINDFRGVAIDTGDAAAMNAKLEDAAALIAAMEAVAKRGLTQLNAAAWTRAGGGEVRMIQDQNRRQAAEALDALSD
ncbi:hypothetical protein [Roseobacter sinensis]|uniref:Uncharacterized protein n=1 Tax=Roseobacter sinensis TaxID=2931391 RepID=A0ABT3BC65_9RHOB|nr:hypothetical protein [Roseobacter sp. WL0113]MCV3271170.1 hypothetical protein [Roseobacter sp. WL0113]